MTRRSLSIALALTLAATPLMAAQARSSAARPAGLMAALQGVWKMTITNGQDAAASGQNITITITDNKYVQAVNGEVVERGTFSVDQTKKPATIDVAILEGNGAGRKQLGVIEVKGNTMVTKLSQASTAARPTDFEIADGYFTFTMVKQ